MKKFNVFTVILTVLLLTSFLAKELQASQSSAGGDKWKIKAVSGPSESRYDSYNKKFHNKSDIAFGSH
jgi:hypothetical protein